MPRVMRCRQSQGNDQSKGIVSGGNWWVRTMPRRRPNPTVPKMTTMRVPSTEVTTISAVIGMIGTPRTSVCGSTKPHSAWAGIGSRTRARAASPTHQAYGHARHRFRQERSDQLTRLERIIMQQREPKRLGRGSPPRPSGSAYLPPLSSFFSSFLSSSANTTWPSLPSFFSSFFSSPNTTTWPPLSFFSSFLSSANARVDIVPKLRKATRAIIRSTVSWEPPYVM